MKSKVNNLFIDDDKRLPLIAENPDWDNTITPALVELGGLVDRKSLDLNSIEGLRLLRILFESVYVMGHDTGEKETK